jgi:hypothetical protein
MTFVDAVKQFSSLDLINNNDGGLTKTTTEISASKCHYLGHLLKPPELSFPEWKDKLRNIIHTREDEEDFRSLETRTNPLVISRLRDEPRPAHVRAAHSELHAFIIQELHALYSHLQEANQNNEYSLPCVYSDCSKCANLLLCYPDADTTNWHPAIVKYNQIYPELSFWESFSKYYESLMGRA